jgi:hypothetical protein
MAAPGGRAPASLGKRAMSAPTGLRPTIMGKTAEVSAASGGATSTASVPAAPAAAPAPLKVTSPVSSARRMCGYCASGRRMRPTSISSLSATMYAASGSDTTARMLTDEAASACAMCSATAWSWLSPVPTASTCAALHRSSSMARRSSSVLMRHVPCARGACA